MERYKTISDYMRDSRKPTKEGQFVSSASHIAMYIAAALLLTMLIWRSILFVRSALGDNPQGAFESRQIMDNFIKAVLIIRMCVFCNDNNDVFV